MNKQQLIFNKIKRLYMSDNPEYFIITNTNDEFKVCIIKDYKLVNLYLDFANAHIPDYPSHQIYIKVNDNIKVLRMIITDSYLTIHTYANSNSVCLYKNQQGKYHLQIPAEKNFSFIIHTDGGAVTVHNKDRYYPTTVKNIMIHCPFEATKAILEEYAGNSFLFKDFIREDFSATMPLSQLNTIYNKTDYIKKEFPTLNLPKTANKMSLHELYAIGCVTKYIKTEQIYLLFENKYRNPNYNIPYPSKRHCKNIAMDYISHIFINKFGTTPYLQDYIDMAITLKEPIDIQLGKKGVQRKHDEYSEKLLTKKYRKKIIIPNTPLKYLNLPAEFHLLNTGKALCEEAKQQKNCVASYIKRIEKGSCVIYTAIINGEHVTIEVVYKKINKKYRIKLRQCRKKYNMQCSKETLEYIQEQIKKVESNAIEKYNKKQKSLQNKS